MGKLATAARASGRSNSKRTSHHKIANKNRQRTPKSVRKQMNRVRLSRKEEMEQITQKASKRLEKLSFSSLTTSIKKKLTNPNTTVPKPKLSRSQRNKFSRQNKKLKKQQSKQEQQNAIFDFTSYDREIESDESSENEQLGNDGLYSDNEQKQERLLQQFEIAHKPKSFDIRKGKLSYQSTSGNWIHESARTEPAPMTESKTDKDNDGDVIINEQQIADYINLGNTNDTRNFVNDSDSDSDEEMEMKEETTVNVSVNANGKLSANEWKTHKKERVNAVKIEIASMGEMILEDPYKNCGLLEVVYGLCADESIQIAQLAMLSMTKIIIDIMPPYKIGTIDQNIALKRHNEKVREFEKILLNSYQSFLKHIFKFARIYHSNVRNKTKKKDPQRFILGRCAIKCILMFIRKCSHFNYTKELIKNVIPLTNCTDEQIRSDSCAAVSSLLSHTPINNATVETVQLLTQRIEKKNFNVHKDQLSVLAHLPLQYLEAPDVEEKEHEKPTKSRYEKELDKKLKKDAKEATAALDKTKMYHRQKVIIEQIFGVYFYILKLTVPSQLLQPALYGMSKFAHLINIELILDLISVISEKLQTEKHTLSLPCKLMCISTTFKCLSGRGSSITFDVRQHYQTIYEALLSVTLNHYEWEYFYLIFECLNSMFGYQASKTMPIERIASFVKRLTNISSQLPPYYALGCQHMARKLMLSDPRLINMLDCEGGYDKEYHAWEDNPDQSNALSCCLWELSMTGNHWHSFMTLYSRDLAAWSEISMKLTGMTADKVMAKYDTSKNGCFKPFVRESKLEKFSVAKHPPRELDNAVCKTEMVDWFGFGGEYTEEVRRVRQRVVEGKGNVESVIGHWSECGDLLNRNQVLKDLNEEYRLLNEVLIAD